MPDRTTIVKSQNRSRSIQALRISVPHENRIIATRENDQEVTTIPGITRKIDEKERKKTLINARNNELITGTRDTELGDQDRTTDISRRPFSTINIREYSPDPDFDNPAAWTYNQSWVHDSAMNVFAPSGYFYTYPLGGSPAMGLVIGEEYLLKLVCSSVTSHTGLVYWNSALVWRSDTDGIGTFEYPAIWNGASSTGFSIGATGGGRYVLDSLSVTGGGGG